LEEAKAPKNWSYGCTEQNSGNGRKNDGKSIEIESLGYLPFIFLQLPFINPLKNHIPLVILLTYILVKPAAD
jgi:hypothetical protein